MKRVPLITSVIAAVLVGTAAYSAVRELGQDELRSNVQSGGSLSLSQVLTIVEAQVEGDLVDVRAFEDGVVFYHVLIKQADGTLAVVILNAKTGRFIAGKSAIAQEIIAAAKTTRGRSGLFQNPPGNSAGKGNNNGQGKGNNGKGNNGKGNNGKGNNGKGNN